MSLRDAPFVLLIALAYFSAGRASASTPTVAEKIFGPWQRVTIEQIKVPVPEAVRTSSLTVVQPRYVAKPLDTACPIYEGRELVGYSLLCTR